MTPAASLEYRLIPLAGVRDNDRIRGHDHQILILAYCGNSDQRPCFFRDFLTVNALATSVSHAEVFKIRPLSESILGNGQKGLALVHYRRSRNAVSLGQPDSADAAAKRGRTAGYPLLANRLQSRFWWRS